MMVLFILKFVQIFTLIMQLVFTEHLKVVDLIQVNIQINKFHLYVFPFSLYNECATRYF